MSIFKISQGLTCIGILQGQRLDEVTVWLDEHMGSCRACRGLRDEVFVRAHRAHDDAIGHLPRALASLYEVRAN